MANILYGVNGEGAGHSTRSREVLAHLVSEGHTVHVASFDRGMQNLRDSFEVTEIYGFRFAYVNNRVRYNRTVAKNLFTAPKSGAQHPSFERTRRCVADRPGDHGFRAVDLPRRTSQAPAGDHDRQPALLDEYRRHVSKRVSTGRGGGEAGVQHDDASRGCQPGHDFFQPKVKKAGTYSFPPILREEILAGEADRGRGGAGVRDVAGPGTSETIGEVRGEFIAYGFGREGREGNVTYKRRAWKAFWRILIGAKAVIANAGFSLVTEALHLGNRTLRFRWRTSSSRRLMLIGWREWNTGPGGRPEQGTSGVVPLQLAALSREAEGSIRGRETKRCWPNWIR